MKNLLPSRMNS